MCDKTTSDAQLDIDAIRIFRQENKSFQYPGIERMCLFLQTEVGELIDAVLRNTGNEIRGEKKEVNISEEVSDVLFDLYCVADYFHIVPSIDPCLNKLKKRVGKRINMENEFVINVLDKGYVQAEDFFVNEPLIAKIARLSHGREMGDNEKTIKFLLDHGHTGPLEASCIVFKIKAPIFVFRQWMRHRIGQGFTERSLRYCEANPEFYCLSPSDQETYDVSWKAYQRALEQGEKKERARRFLPVGLYSETYWYPNLVALRHWLLLRLNNDAQWEIQQYAKAVMCILKNIAPITAKIISSEAWE